jgi:hypothetical protein
LANGDITEHSVYDAVAVCSRPNDALLPPWS